MRPEATPNSPARTPRPTNTPQEDTGTLSERWSSSSITSSCRWDLGLFFFAWANAGVAFGNLNSVTFMVLISLIVGKTVGVSLFSLIVSKMGFPLPEGMGVRHLAVAGLIAGLGLTVALFVANKAYNTPEGLAFLDPGKMGAVFSVVVAALAFAFARLIGVRREPD